FESYSWPFRMLGRRKTKQPVCALLTFLMTWVSGQSQPRLASTRHCGSWTEWHVSRRSKSGLPRKETPVLGLRVEWGLWAAGLLFIWTRCIATCHAALLSSVSPARRPAYPGAGATG